MSHNLKKNSILYYFPTFYRALYFVSSNRWYKVFCKIRSVSHIAAPL